MKLQGIYFKLKRYSTPIMFGDLKNVTYQDNCGSRQQFDKNGRQVPISGNDKSPGPMSIIRFSFFFLSIVVVYHGINILTNKIFKSRLAIEISIHECKDHLLIQFSGHPIECEMGDLGSLQPHFSRSSMFKTSRPNHIF